jgi:hypothetical protein
MERESDRQCLVLGNYSYPVAGKLRVSTSGSRRSQLRLSPLIIIGNAWNTLMSTRGCESTEGSTAQYTHSTSAYSNIAASPVHSRQIAATYSTVRTCRTSTRQLSIARLRLPIRHPDQKRKNTGTKQVDFTCNVHLRRASCFVRASFSAFHAVALYNMHARTTRNHRR